jgi:hypothetical protein
MVFANKLRVSIFSMHILFVLLLIKYIYIYTYINAYELIVEWVLCFMH